MYLIDRNMCKLCPWYKSISLHPYGYHSYSKYIGYTFLYDPRTYTNIISKIDLFSLIHVYVYALNVFHAKYFTIVWNAVKIYDLIRRMDTYVLYGQSVPKRLLTDMRHNSTDSSVSEISLLGFRLWPGFLVHDRLIPSNIQGCPRSGLWVDVYFLTLYFRAIPNP